MSCSYNYRLTRSWSQSWSRSWFLSWFCKYFFFQSFFSFFEIHFFQISYRCCLLRVNECSFASFADYWDFPFNALKRNHPLGNYQYSGNASKGQPWSRDPTEINIVFKYIARPTNKQESYSGGFSYWKTFGWRDFYNVNSNSGNVAANLIHTCQKRPYIPGKCTESNSDFWRTTPLSRGFRQFMVFQV